jgi:hypothetical protein
MFYFSFFFVENFSMKKEEQGGLILWKITLCKAHLRLPNFT